MIESNCLGGLRTICAILLRCWKVYGSTRWSSGSRIRFFGLAEEMRLPINGSEPMGNIKIANADYFG